jgi:hypothetical protein
MNDDHSWLKNPILPRPPAVPRFSAAELRLVDEDRPSSVMRVAPRKERAAAREPRRPQRVSGTSAVRPAEAEREAPQPRSRRIA